MKTKIEKSEYEGYLWYSDNTEPKVYLGNESFELELDDNKNPFVIEGQLFDGKKSYSIKYADGQYYVNSFDVKSSDFNSKDEKEYIPNSRMKDVNKIKFLQRWKTQEDELCEGMEVLQPAELVFIGFDKKKED